VGFYLVIPGSNAQFVCGGTAAYPLFDSPPMIEKWNGSGSLPPYDQSSNTPPPNQYFSSVGSLLNVNSPISMSFPIVPLLAVPGGPADCTQETTYASGMEFSEPLGLLFGTTSVKLALAPPPYSTAVIQPPLKPLTYPQFPCGQGTCTELLQWDAIPPVSGSAPDPTSAR
jgi:hypothetical protein